MVHVNRFHIDSFQTEVIREFKILGIFFDDELLWTGQISKRSSKLSSTVGLLCRARKFWGRKWLINIYNTLFLPYINYCCIIWGCASHSALGLTDMIQRRALEAILGASHHTSTRYMYDELKVFIVSHIFNIQVSIFMH